MIHVDVGFRDFVTDLRALLKRYPGDKYVESWTRCHLVTCAVVLEKLPSDQLESKEVQAWLTEMLHPEQIGIEQPPPEQSLFAERSLFARLQFWK